MSKNKHNLKKIQNVKIRNIFHHIWLKVVEMVVNLQNLWLKHFSRLIFSLFPDFFQKGMLIPDFFQTFQIGMLIPDFFQTFQTFPDFKQIPDIFGRRGNPGINESWIFWIISDKNGKFVSFKRRKYFFWRKLTLINRLAKSMIALGNPNNCFAWS